MYNKDMLPTIVLTKKTAIATSTGLSLIPFSPELGFIILFSYALGVITTIVAIKIHTYVKQ